jgi:adenylate cyclase
MWKGIISKTRFEIKIEVICTSGWIYDDNEGLIIAEIELSSEEETFIKPDWLAVEVTNDKRYYNSYLSTKPFTSW